MSVTKQDMCEKRWQVGKNLTSVTKDDKCDRIDKC